MSTANIRDGLPYLRPEVLTEVNGDIVDAAGSFSELINDHSYKAKMADVARIMRWAAEALMHYDSALEDTIRDIWKGARASRGFEEEIHFLETSSFEEHRQNQGAASDFYKELCVQCARKNDWTALLSTGIYCAIVLIFEA
ncbi:hypothetical protein EVJ58_g2499 [Rhodofomes roseus]|uniref:Uncharacterized protein n=1 Tax=Rhodofomes roseus TaxID=34475 RepID=A0A4Y9YSC8_9APHY|nr:hypothetical protein EVJ58_g2499 [Rhodofomes roseus]